MSSQTIKYRMVHFKPRFQALFNSRLDSNCHFGNKTPCNFESEDIELLAQIPSLYIHQERSHNHDAKSQLNICHLFNRLPNIHRSDR